MALPMIQQIFILRLQVSILEYIENGRRYQTVQEPGQFPVPADDKQFESLQAGHLLCIILESQQKTPLFRAPVDGKRIQNILDLGPGDGAWATDTADRYPQAIVTGVDLYPPPQTWVPPNCILEVDDITEPFTFQIKFDLIHIRQLLAAFGWAEWDALYRRIYDDLERGGWIEHPEQSVAMECDDGSAPDDAPILNGWKVLAEAGVASENPLTVFDEMKERIEKAGFVNVQEKVSKIRYGTGPRRKI